MRQVMPILAFLLALAPTTRAQQLPEGAWTAARSQELLGKTLRLTLDPDLGALSAGERVAVAKLIEAGRLMQELYEQQSHADALEAHAQMLGLHEQGVPGSAELLDLYRMMKGPIATTLDNQRVPIWPVREETAGKNVYPDGLTREELDGFLERHPERRAELMHLRSVVRRADAAQIAADLATLDAHPALDTLHPGLRARLESGAADPATLGYYAVGYSIAFADRILRIYELLHEAADATEDEAFARFLRLRARDLLADDYDGGDAAWVTSDFTGNLNAQIGSYETYDDALYGVRSFFSLSLLLRDKPRSDELSAAIGDIQLIEDALPYTAHKRVRSDIPVGVYNVIADFGQSRGTNTATILPNEAHLSRQYGRTILIRSNILTNPQLFALSATSFRAAVAKPHHDDLMPEGGFYRTLWHEVGHYLGVDRTRDGRDLDVALQNTADLLEEMKADLVSLFAARMLHEGGIHDDGRLRAIQAGGVRRVLQNNKPRRSQPYNTMQLIQWNWYLDRGMLSFEDGALKIDYGRYDQAVESLLAEVLDLQFAGDLARAEAFIDRWTNWDEALHGVIAAKIRDAQTTRYRLVSYGAMGESDEGPLR